jgi:hypothetical protein
MRTLWHALALLASNEELRDEVKAASDIEIREDQPTEPVDLQPQPTFQALQKIDDLFTKQEPPLYLSAYELGEINRWVRYRRGVEPVAEMWRSLNVPNNPSEDLMAAIGAMAIDSKLRFRAWYEHSTNASRAQAGGQASAQSILRDHGFNLHPNEQDVLTQLRPGGPADNLCKQFFLDIWGGYPCTSLATVYPGWLHSNA